MPATPADLARMDVEDVIKVMKAAVGNPQVQQQGPVVAVVPRPKTQTLFLKMHTYWFLHVSVPNLVGNLNQDSSKRFQLSLVFKAWFSKRFQEVSTNKLLPEPHIRAGWFASDAWWFHELILALKPDEATPLSNYTQTARSWSKHPMISRISSTLEQSWWPSKSPGGQLTSPGWNVGLNGWMGCWVHITGGDVVFQAENGKKGEHQSKWDDLLNRR